MGQIYQHKSNPRETITNTIYSTNITPPIGLVIFHLKIIMAKKTNTNMINNRLMEHPIPPEFTLTAPPEFAAEYKSHGKGNLMKN